MRLLVLFACLAAALPAQVAVRADIVYTMAGAAIRDGVILMRDGKIERVGPSALLNVPSGYQTLLAKAATPGLIDARTVVGLAGYLNQPHDQEQLERSAPLQPELRAADAYDPRDRLVEFFRSMGVTTIHTGHAPGAVISGQTMIVKTKPGSVEETVVVPEAMVAATLGEAARAAEGKPPGTRAKAVALLRAELIKAREYAAKADKPRDLRLEALARVVKGETPLLVTVQRVEDILTALRVGKEFQLKLVLDGVADAPLAIGQIKASGYPVILHPTMARAGGETANLSLETAARLRERGVLFAIESGYESYVPRTRLVLFEAAMAAANGLGFENALAAVTIDAARLLGIDKRVGSIEPGKDADVALFDGDPFEFTSHCTGVVIDGRVVSAQPH